MALALIPPGKRKNKFYLVRGRHDGRLIEINTKTLNEAQAKRFLKETKRELARAGVPQKGDLVSFAEAARLYAGWRGLDLDNPQTHDGRQRTDVARINRLIGVLGKKPLTAIAHIHLVDAANQLYPDRANATKNREAMRPAGAILHYANKNGLCPWLRIALFKEPAPKPRAVTKRVAVTVIDATAAADPDKQMLLVWLFQQGNRITETLQVKWEDIDLNAGSVAMYIKKTNEWQIFPLQPEVIEHLAAVPEARRHGRVWPWSERSSVYYWLRPLVRELGVKFTPHMARHSVGTWLNAEGAGLATIMARLGHKDDRSSMRYQSADIEVVRAASNRIGRLGSTPPQRRAT